MTKAHTKKLIEAALPLPEINDASAHDKMPGIGPHPKGIHHWWARLPLPTARAILFASIVDDPEAHPEKWSTEEEQSTERERLFEILRRLMRTKVHEKPEIYADAEAEMLKYCDGELPTVFDPFSGGGSIPLEAHRMGFSAHAGDLNPVAVLLNKCNLEIAPRWKDCPPINPTSQKKLVGRESWKGTDGLATDVEYYGAKIRDLAVEKIGHLYPKAQLQNEQGGSEANVISWIWARTVASPNPAAHGKHVPLINTYWLCNKKKMNRFAWLEPSVNRIAGTYSFSVRFGEPQNISTVSSGTKVGNSGFKCILSDDPITYEYIREQGQSNSIGTKLIAIVVDLGRGRTYLPANEYHEKVARSAHPSGYPETDLPDKALGFRVQNYGIRQHWQLFTPRQLTTLITLSDLITEIKEDIIKDFVTVGGVNSDAQDYSKAVCTMLALTLDRCADFNCNLCTWTAYGEQQKSLFRRQAIPMVWDFSEANILGEKAISWHNAVDITAKAVRTLGVRGSKVSSARQIDAAAGVSGIDNLLVSTDPPYYDNIGYAALSDFFYVWLRRTLIEFYPDEFSTLLVPKMPELTAAPERFHDDRESAKKHFEEGFRSAFSALRTGMDSRFPLTVYYAFKQADELSRDSDDKRSTVDLTTGWETLLEALISSGFQITGTWPVRASQKWRINAMGTNALASYVVLACRPRSNEMSPITSNRFRSELKHALPASLRHLQQGNIAPVDFAQAAIGPGMAIYSRYSRILDPSGTSMSVRTALGIINQTLDEVLSERDDDFEPDTRWAIAWFEQNGFNAGDYGEAELLSKAKVTAVSGLVQAGIVESNGGKVRLLSPVELPANWDPTGDTRLTVWEMTHHLLRLYHFEKAGDEATAALLRRLGSRGEVARELAYRLHSISERRKWSQEAQGYNALVLGWPEIARLAREVPVAASKSPTQDTLI